MKKICLLVCVALLGGALGCFTQPAGLTSSTLPITARDTYTIINSDAEGRDSSLSILGISLMPYNAYNALQNAKQRYGADGLINVTCENKTFWITLVSPLITWHTVTVRGEAIKLERGGAIDR